MAWHSLYSIVLVMYVIIKVDDWLRGFEQYPRFLIIAAPILCITVDNVIASLYFNGVAQTIPANGNDWTQTKCFPLPTFPVQIAVQCTDSGVQAGLLASVTGDILLTDGSWKCTKTLYPNWMSTNYSASAWPGAYVIGLNGLSPWDVRPGISANASWIYTTNYLNNADTPVYCRKD